MLNLVSNCSISSALFDVTGQLTGGDLNVG